MTLTYSPHERLWRLAIFSGALLLFLCNLSRNHSYAVWDVIERACFLKYQSEAPPWGIFFFAHMLEIPLAAGLGKCLPWIREPIMLLQILECMFGALLTLLLYDLCMTVSRRHLLSLGASGLLVSAFAFWRMTTSGEEKIITAFFITLFISLYFPFHALSETPGISRPALIILSGIVLGVSALIHLMALILWPLIALCIALGRRGFRCSRFGMAESIVVALIGFVLLASVYGFVAYSCYGLESPRDIARGLLSYHGPKFSYWYFSQPPHERSIFDNVKKSLIGIERVVFAERVVNRYGSGLGLTLLAVILSAAIAAARNLRTNPLIMPCTVFLILWGAFFIFYEPDNPESWIGAYPCFLILASSLLALHAPRVIRAGECALIGAVVLVLWLNCPAYASLGRYNNAELSARALDGMVPPGAVVIVGNGAEQRYARYCSHRRVILAHHLESGKTDWFDTAKINGRGIMSRLTHNRPVYATKLGVLRLPQRIRDAARWRRVEGVQGWQLYELHHDAGEH